MILWTAISDEQMTFYRFNSKYEREYIEILEVGFEGKATQTLVDMLKHQKNLFLDLPITQHLIKQATEDELDKIKEFLVTQGLAQQTGTYERLFEHFRWSYLNNPIQRYVYNTCHDFIASYPAHYPQSFEPLPSPPLHKIYWVFARPTDRKLKLVNQAPTTLGKHRKYDTFIQQVGQYSGLACELPMVNKELDNLPNDGIIVIFSWFTTIRRLMYLLDAPPTLFRRIFLIDFGVVESELNYGGLPLAGSLKGAYYMRYFVRNESIQNAINPLGFVVDGRAMNVSQTDNNPYYYHRFSQSLPQELGAYLKQYAQNFSLFKNTPYPTLPLVSSLERGNIRTLPESPLAIDTPPAKIYIASQKPYDLERKKEETTYWSLSQERKYEELAERISLHTQLPCSLVDLNEEWTNLPLDGMIIFFTDKGFFDQWRRLEVAKHPTFARKLFLVSFDIFSRGYDELDLGEFAGKMDDTNYGHYARRWMVDHSNDVGFWGRKAALYPEQGFGYDEGYIFRWCDDADNEGIELPEALGEYLLNYIKLFAQFDKT